MSEVILREMLVSMREKPESPMRVSSVRIITVRKTIRSNLPGHRIPTPPVQTHYLSNKTNKTNKPKKTQTEVRKVTHLVRIRDAKYVLKERTTEHPPLF